MMPRCANYEHFWVLSNVKLREWRRSGATNTFSMKHSFAQYEMTFVVLFLSSKEKSSQCQWLSRLCQSRVIFIKIKNVKGSHNDAECYSIPCCSLLICTVTASFYSLLMAKELNHSNRNECLTKPCRWN